MVSKSKIFTKLRQCADDTPGRAGSVNLWHQWISNPAAVRWLLNDEDALRTNDVDAVEGWADKMLEWGMHVQLHPGTSGRQQLIEVFGPDQEVPHVLLYRVGEEVQVDEYHGASRRCVDMPGALEFITGHT